MHGQDEQAAALMRGEQTGLNIGYYPIGDAGAGIVADFLKHDQTLKSVFLHSCNIGPRGFKAIAKSLKHNQAVEYLEVLWNDLGDKGAEALIDALAGNVCMKELIVLETHIVTLELHATIEYLTKTRNQILIPAAARQASLSLIAARRNINDAGSLAIFPKEIVRMIAMEVWATRREPIWIQAVSGPKYTAQQTNIVERLMEDHEIPLLQ